MAIRKKKYAVFLFLVLFVCTGYRTAYSQIALTTENMALGGGGTAYLTGFESLFVNPANLYIREKNYRFQISLLQGGIYYDTVLPVSNNIDRYNNFTDHLRFFNSRSPQQELRFSDYETVLNRNYPGNKTRREFLSEIDFYWFGLKWMRPERSYAVSFRTRYASRYELGRGFFSSTPEESNNRMTVDQSFSQSSQVLHELSFGYAESFTFLNGLLPQLSEFIIGIAPKIVVAGASLDANYTNLYKTHSEATGWNQILNYQQQTSGVLSGSGEQFFGSPGGLPDQVGHSFSDLMKPAGIGAGLNVGITYLITFGDDLSVLRQQNEPTEKSLRLSLSVTDLGVVYQYKTPYEYISEKYDVITTQTGPLSGTTYTGAPNEHLAFLSQFESFTDLNSYSQNSEPFDLLLPASIQSGVLFQFQHLKLAGDLSYSLAESPFNHSGLASYIGFELRPLSFIPVRGGTRFARGVGGYYSFGTGLETKQFDLNISVLLKSRKVEPSSEILGLSFLGLKFYLQ